MYGEETRERDFRIGMDGERTGEDGERIAIEDLLGEKV